MIVQNRSPSHAVTAPLPIMWPCDVSTLVEAEAPNLGTPSQIVWANDVVHDPHIGTGIGLGVLCWDGESIL